MAKPKLIQLLQACEKEEWVALIKFSLSPFHNANQALVRLLKHLKSEWPDFSPGTCSKQQLFQAAYPAAPFEDKKLRYLLSDGCRLLEAFWTIRVYQRNPARQHLDMLDELSNRQLKKLYSSYRTRWLDQRKDKQIREPHEYYHEYRFAATEEVHFERQRLRVFDFSIQGAAQALDRFYFFQQLTYACGMLERQSILQGEYQLSFSEQWLSHLEQFDFFSDPQIELYYAILQMQRHPETEDHFLRLQGLLRQNKLLISQEVLRSGYLAAINFCVRNLRKGKDQYVERALELYTEGLETGVLFDNGLVSPWTFNNTVKLALRLQRYSWIEGFIARYQTALPDRFRNDVLHYNQAELYYYTNRFDEAQAALNEVTYSDPNYYLGARVILAKIYYETEAIEALLSLVAAFTIFLKRNRKISANLKKTYLNFCELLFQLTKVRKEKLPALREQIHETTLLTDRAWLLTQVEKLQ